MLTIVYCTRESKPEHKEHLIKTSGLHKHLEIIEIVNNGEALTKAYNRGLQQATNDIVVFCHDDITIETKQWGHKLLKLMSNNQEYGIIGVAGTKYLSQSGKWWENPKKMYGRVQHTHEGKTWLSSYSDDLGKEIEETVLVDGLFFAVDKTKLKKTFNEDVEGFHFYDVTFCFENFLEGVKIGVTTIIRVNHQSVGMTNEQWEVNRQKFVDKFKDKLPVTIDKKTRKNEKLKILFIAMSLENDSENETYFLNIIKKLKENNHSVTVMSKINKKQELMFKNNNIKVANLLEPPGFKLGDGKWGFNTDNGYVLSKENNLYKINEPSFDLIYITNPQLFEHFKKLYGDFDFVSVESSPENTPITDPLVISYFAKDDVIKNNLITKFSIDSNNIKMFEPKVVTRKKLNKYIKGPIKIVSGWSDKGGSTFALIRLTKELNNAGYDATFYGPHKWHLDKCKSGVLDETFSVKPNDRLITHFINLPKRPNAGKVVLSCHEKNLFEVGKITKYWDEVVFLNEKHRKYHSDYNGPYQIIPNFKQEFIRRDKTGLDKIAGVIGSFDENKQTHVSINRALVDGCEKIYLFGEIGGVYYDNFVKPLLSDKVIVMGFYENKQQMYDMIGRVYHSSKSEVACLVKDECLSTGVSFYGNESTEYDNIDISNNDILKEWIKILEL